MKFFLILSGVALLFFWVSIPLFALADIDDCASYYSAPYTVTGPALVTVTIQDCCFQGDYYQVYVDGQPSGYQTFNPGWDCSKNPGSNLSNGVFTFSVTPGSHEIKLFDPALPYHMSGSEYVPGWCFFRCDYESWLYKLKRLWTTR